MREFINIVEMNIPPIGLPDPDPVYPEAEDFDGKPVRVTADELTEMFPGIEDTRYFPGATFTLVTEPMTKFAKRASAKYGVWTAGAYPRDIERVKKILNELRDGAGQRPIFIKDGSLEEGHHRLVAFFVMRMTTLPVVYVTSK